MGSFARTTLATGLSLALHIILLAVAVTVPLPTSSTGKGTVVVKLLGEVVPKKSGMESESTKGNKYPAKVKERDSGNRRTTDQQKAEFKEVLTRKEEPPSVESTQQKVVASVVAASAQKTGEERKRAMEHSVEKIVQGTGAVDIGVGTQGSIAGEIQTREPAQELRRGSGKTVARPHYHVNPKPPYPRIARRLGAEGVVTLRVFVQKDGSVGKVFVAESSGFGMLDDAATRTVSSMWKFVPAELDGDPVDSWVEVPIKFVLESM